MIKKLSTIILILTAVAIAILIRAKSSPEDYTTFASTPDLQITWQENPLFTVINMLPGDSVTRTVTVKNLSTSIKPLGIRGVPTSATPSSFPTQLKLKILENSLEIKNYTLAEFFTASTNDGFVAFTNLHPGSTAVYTFIVTFDQASGNAYQNAQVIFDLILGLQFTLPTECQRWASYPDTRFVFGTDGKDTLVGNNYPSVLVGFGGNDVLNGNNQEDCLLGGDGHDKLHGNNKNDVLLGGDGDDDLNSNHGDDYLDGGPGNNKLDGSNGTDICKNGTLFRCER